AVVSSSNALLEHVIFVTLASQKQNLLTLLNRLICSLTACQCDPVTDAVNLAIRSNRTNTTYTEVTSLGLLRFCVLTVEFSLAALKNFPYVDHPDLPCTDHPY